MSATQWTLNCSLLVWVLMRNLGTKPVSRATYAAPLLVVGLAAAIFLRHVPTTGHDAQLELVGTGAGAALGVLATALTHIRRSTSTQVTITAGTAFAALWVLVIGGRVAFAEWATHTGSRTIGEFSMRHQITGADAWTATFVLMALAMFLARVASTAAIVHRTRNSAQPHAHQARTAVLGAS